MLSRKQFAARIWSKLIAYERKNSFLKDGDRVLAAVSGGADSVCLAHYLAQARKRRRLSLNFLHVHHGLRGRDADRDARFVEQLGQCLDVPVTVVHVKTVQQAKIRGQGIEDAARKLRYEAFAHWARALRCNKVATAHHMDDQAETVLLNLIRGTQLSALAGIPARRPLARRIEVIRPLLTLQRADVLEYIGIHGLKYRTDKSNFSTNFTRNWIRRRVIPLLETRNPRIREHLAGIAEQVNSAGS